MLAVLQLVVLSFTASARIRSYAMATSQRALAQMTGAVDFESLSRRELQALAKKAGIRANQKSVEIIAQLHLASDHQSSPAANADAAEEAAIEPIVALAAANASPYVDAAESVAPKEPMVAAVVGVDLIERDLPKVLTPARCEAGRWQPLRLVGDEIELTLLVRDTGQAVETLDAPRLMLLGEELGALSVEAQPVVSLTAAQVEQSLQWTSAVLGLLGVEDPSLFPPAAEILTAEGFGTPSAAVPSATASSAPASSASAGAASEDVSAAILFLPTEGDLEKVSKLNNESHEFRVSEENVKPM